jgi:hypothetical protein
MTRGLVDYCGMNVIKGPGASARLRQVSRRYRGREPAGREVNDRHILGRSSGPTASATRDAVLTVERCGHPFPDDLGAVADALEPARSTAVSARELGSPRVA